MPLPETTTSPAPLKNMDIKTAFLAASNRKRKASPTLHKTPLKSVKLDDQSEDGIEIIMETSETGSIGECKENTDLNTVDPQHISQVNGKVSPSKSLTMDIQKADNAEQVKTASQNSDCDSSKESSDELNSSNLNNSVSALHTSELSESAENPQTSEKDLNSSTNQVSRDSVKEKGDSNQNDKKSKRKKKMTAEEAKARSAEREEKQKESLLKKQELDAQKLQKKLEKEKLRIQKEQEKLEKEEERKEKERLKQEKKDQEEKERLQKLKEKEEGKKQRQLMLEMKQEEKKKKDEMRLKREEESKKVEEEKRKAKLEKEQKEKEKKEKAKAAFFKFFTKGSGTATPPPQVVEKEGNFKPFQVSDAMILAPVVPQVAQERFDKEQLDHVLQSQGSRELYLQNLRSGSYNDVRLRKRQRKQHMSDADVIIVNEQNGLFITAKLLQFKENIRPPYWGTWRKKSNTVKGRTPFGQDAIFDYDNDSDDEWDEGGPGESLSGTENEIESEDDYEVDNEFFVPHGYLSAEEEKEDDAEENDPEKQKVRLKLKQQEFEKERKKKTVKLEPKILGCYFENGCEQDSNLRTFLLEYSCEIVFDAPIPTIFTIKKNQAETPQSVLNSPSSSNSTNKKSVPEEAMPHLIRLVHGNINSRETLVKEFQAFWQQHCQVSCNSEESPQSLEPTSTSKENSNPDQETTSEVSAPDSINLSKRQINLTIKKSSTYGKCPNPAQKKFCWWVQDEVREKYGLLDAPIPNEWSNVSVKEEVESSPSVAKANTTSIKEFLIP